MVDVPSADPVATPDDEPIVATEVLLLTHNPPAGEALRVDDPPEQKLVLPVITPVGFTFIVFVAVVTSPHASVEVTV